jgi:hydroxymethylpyrimidine pyrophosphatase-like HAD family hydrolase
MGYALGLDLHGTLIEDGELIRPELRRPLIEALEAVKGDCRLFVCTGNDLTFLRRKISSDILSLFDGFILETGCVYSDGAGERVLTGPGVAASSRELEAKLKGFSDPEVYKFDRRLTSIAIFTRYGHSPAEYKVKVEERVRSLGYDGLFYTTHSSVAVDVVPRGFDKFTGLKAVSDGLKTVGVADSMNDIHLHIGCDYSFAPKNIGEGLRRALMESGRDVVALSDAVEIVKGVTYVADGPATEGVIQILKSIESIR